MKAEYKNGQIVIDNGLVVIDRDGRISAREGGSYYVGLLFNALCEYFKENLPARLVVRSVDSDGFEIEGAGGFKIQKDGEDLLVSVFGNSVLEYSGGEEKMVLWDGKVQLEEDVETDIVWVVNLMFGGRVCLGANVAWSDGVLLIESAGNDVLEIGYDGFADLSNFCLLQGEIFNATGLDEWLRGIAAVMEFESWDRKGDGLIFKFGASRVAVDEKGNFVELVWEHRGLRVELNEYSIRVRYSGGGRVIDLSGLVVEELREIPKEVNKFLRKLAF